MAQFLIQQTCEKVPRNIFISSFYRIIVTEANKCLPLWHPDVITYKRQQRKHLFLFVPLQWSGKCKLRLMYQTVPQNGQCPLLLQNESNFSLQQPQWRGRMVKCNLAKSMWDSLLLYSTKWTSDVQYSPPGKVEHWWWLVRQFSRSWHNFSNVAGKYWEVSRSKLLKLVVISPCK